MSIDAVIQGVRRMPDKSLLLLRGRQAGERPGRRLLYVTRNPGYEPQVGDEIWGDTQKCLIGEHVFWRIMKLYDGTFQSSAPLPQELCKLGVCPDCGNAKQCMHDGQGRLWCPVCGAMYEIA